ncbi:hypothetical protein TNCV_521751 [Trichonephila clavipes]|nr:hypothetical protein TNCV_521751 [Trichonephila clavipes]
MSCISFCGTYERQEIHEQKHTITLIEECRFFITNDNPSIGQETFAAFHSRWESISGENQISFPEDTYLNPSPPYYKTSVRTTMVTTGWCHLQMNPTFEDLPCLQMVSCLKEAH